MTQQPAPQQIGCAGAGAGLCLHPPGCCPVGSTCLATAVPQPLPVASKEAPQLQQQRLTIVYGGHICALDVTDAQAQMILRLVSKEAPRVQPSCSSPMSPSYLPQHGDGGQRGVGVAVEGSAEASGFPRDGVLGQSMKGSLRRFLEKRATRRGEANVSPYSAAAKVDASSL